MKSDFLIAVTQLAAERHLPREAVISAIEAALASAYKKDSLLAGQDISVSLNPANGEVKLYTQKTVVEKPQDTQKEIGLAEARRYKADAKLEDVIDVECSIQSTGRIAAQTAKQVVLQRLREAERELVYEEYIEKEGDIVTATVQRADSRQVTLALGRTEAVLPPSEQVPTERYRAGQNLKVFVVEVRRTSRGPEILVSRTHRDLLRRLFEMEVPEIHNGVVEIKAVAREAGSRSKVAVYSRQDGVDPVGSCVGLRGIRIQNIVNELQGEKIDVIQWHPEPEVFLANALSPCPVTRVEINRESGEAMVVVPDRQLSLAIGKEGQNARLCARLAGYKVTIRSVTEAEEERVQRVAEASQHLKEAAVTLQVEEQQAEPVVQAAAEGTGLEEAVDPGVLEAAANLEVLQVGDREVSIEEQLAEATLEIAAGEAKEEKALGEAQEIPDVVWAVPRVAPKPQRVRFAEEIIGPRGGEPRADTTRARKKGKQGKAEEEARPGKRSRRVQYPVEGEHDEEVWEEEGLAS